MKLKKTMCRKAVLAAASLLQLLLFSLPANAASPSGCQGCGVGVAPLTLAGTVKSGSVVLYDVGVANTIIGSCDIVNATVTFYCPGLDGLPNMAAPQVLTTTLNLPFGASATVATGIPCTVTTTSSKTAQALATVSGAPGSCLKGASDAASGTGTTTVEVRHPCVEITKECVNTCTPIGKPILVKGKVTNCGDEPLDITLSDVPAAAITPATITGLAPGASVEYTGSYTPTGDLCGPFTDTVTAKAIGVDTGTVLQDKSATATCHVQTSPKITLVKNCYKEGSPGTKDLTDGDKYVETFTVSNTGDVALKNVKVTDIRKGVTTEYSIGDLAAGASTTVTAGPFTVTFADCPSITDEAVATGDNSCPPDAECPAPATVSSDKATCTVNVSCEPQICVTKEVTCAPASKNCGDAALVYGKTASGISGATDPLFCYKFTVWNCGKDDLENVTLTDPDIGPLVVPSTLKVGSEKVVVYATKTWPGAGTFPNKVTADATGVVSKKAVTASDTATVTVAPAAVTCSIVLSSSVDLDNNPDNNHVTLPAGTDPQPVLFTLTINNTGQADLSVGAADLPVCSDAWADVNNAPVTFPIALAAGKSITIHCTVEVVCPLASYKVTVTGEAVASTAFPCIYDKDGNKIKTLASSCDASVDCQQPKSCRTTGGGDLVPGTIDNAGCYTVETTITTGGVPDLGVVKVTHGGQLGAPYSQQDCGEILGNPCIRGQWQHVRHYQGKGNPRDTITSLHTITPKGQFDSLSCACLPCCDDPDVNQPNGNFNGIGKKFELCNKDDHKICGPMPRPAPANALIWSGLGKLQNETDTGKADLEWVVLRVYIVDRSEPGGKHPGGAVAPADIYCYQVWKTGIKVSKKPGSYGTVDVAAGFRKALAENSCNFLAARAGGDLADLGIMPDTTVDGQAADIVDMGPLLNGNRQIHPSTSATCE